MKLSVQFCTLSVTKLVGHSVRVLTIIKYLKIRNNWPYFLKTISADNEHLPSLLSSTPLKRDKLHQVQSRVKDTQHAAKWSYG